MVEEGEGPGPGASAVSPRAPQGAESATRIVASGGRPDPEATAWREAAIAPGTVLINTYRIDSILARGGMGEIYRATHVEMGTEHAIKVIRPELAGHPKVMEMFRREASSLRTVRNDAVVAYDGVFRDEGGQLYLVMEFLVGQPLSDVIEERRLSVAELRTLRDRLASGLAAAHEKGIIHRDISPDNVILPDGQVGLGKIIDFGIVKLADPAQATVIGSDFAGKYSYASPEQLGLFGGKVDARSDIYSLGLVLAAAAMGRPPITGGSPSEMIEARKSVPDLGGVPEGIRPEIAAMLAPDPADRPRSMRELIGRDGAPGETPARAAAPAPHRRREARGARGRRGMPWVAAAAALVILAAGGAYLVYFVDRPGEKKDPDIAVAALQGPTLTPAEPSAVTPTPSLTTPPPAPPVTARPAEPRVTARPAAPLPVAPPAPAVSSGPTLAPAPPAPPPRPAATEAPAPSTPPPAEPQIASRPPPAPADRGDLKAELDGLLGGYSCSRLAGSVPSAGRLAITGFVSQAGDLQRLSATLAERFAAAERRVAVRVYEWPLCEVLLKLKPTLGMAAGSGEVPGIEPNHADRVYRRGDAFKVTVTAPAQAARYLHVVYLINNGEVIHMYPPTGAAPKPSAAGSRIALGQEGTYRIGEPFGRDMIVAIASDRPLFPGLSNQVQTADAFFGTLGRALGENGSAGRTASRSLIITTKP